MKSLGILVGLLGALAFATQTGAVEPKFQFLEDFEVESLNTCRLKLFQVSPPNIDWLQAHFQLPFNAIVKEIDVTIKAAKIGGGDLSNYPDIALLDITDTPLEVLSVIPGEALKNNTTTAETETFFLDEGLFVPRYSTTSIELLLNDEITTGQYNIWTTDRITPGINPTWRRFCKFPLDADDGFFITEMRGVIIRPEIWSTPFFNIAYATSSCEFVVSGPTTTAECSDQVIINTTHNLFSGFLLFFIVFFGLLFFFRK